MSQVLSSPLAEEVRRRRTFAIISHPDAGKTTLTEKLLLYGGAIQKAGSVKARSSQKTATSDWMALEKQRGISVTSTVIQFNYHNYVLNLLDTPGHNDFSADTYRTLTAADSAVMLVDNAKGVEAQTEKLFEVCRRRGIPIFTFVNKMDHSGMGPLAVMEDIEAALGIRSVPMNWPIGEGIDFKGIYDRSTKVVHLYQRTARGATKAELASLPIDDPALPEAIGQDYYDKLIEEIELLDVAADPFDEEKVLAGELTPMFFGSALTNFGVEPFLQTFIGLAPQPTPRVVEETKVQPEDGFKAFVFKIQANMNPEHRDRMAFVRVVSGKFEKDMDVVHVQSGKEMKVSRPQRVFANERVTVETAYPGDILGVPNPGYLRLGDTLALDQSVAFDEVPGFTPEVFAIISNTDASKYKNFDKGMIQLSEEGLVDLFFDESAASRRYVLGVVGQLQFDVVRFRLATEYKVETEIMPMAQSIIVWVDAEDSAWTSIVLPSDVRRMKDRAGKTVLLVNSEFQLRYLNEKFDPIKLSREPLS